MRHVAGKANLVADCLSRVLTDGVASFCCYGIESDIFVLWSASTGHKIQEVAVQEGCPILLCNVYTGCLRPLVPGPRPCQIFELVRSHSHSVVWVSVKLVGSEFV